MIDALLKNWRTTAAGLLMILSAGTHLVFAIKNHTADESSWIVAFTTILGGIGLLAAGDAGQSQKQLDQAKEQVKTAIQTGNTDILTKPPTP